MNDPAAQYCPICARLIVAINREEAESGEHSGYIFVHDDIPHSDDDMMALSRGMQ